MADITDNNQAQTTPVDNGGINNQIATAADNKPAEVFKIYNTQKEFDDHSAKIKGNAKTEAEKDFLAALGLKPEEKEKLAKFKEAYDASLSAEEKANEDLQKLQLDYKSLIVQNEDKDLKIAVLTKLSQKTLEDIDAIAKMAKGLISDTTTSEQAVETVLSMIGQNITSQNTDQMDNNTQIQQSQMPKGITLTQPDTPPNVETNPFKKETWNGSAQVALYKQDPVKAKRLSEAAGVKIGW